MRNTFLSVFRNLSIRRKSYNAPISVNGIEVRGDVNGNIVIGHGNRILQYVVNKIHGTVINYYTRPAVKLRDVKPQPPRLPTDFVGRETELKALEQQIKSRNAVLLHGHEGIGKTTLIKKAANGDATSALPDGVIFLEREEDQSQILGFEDLLQKLFEALHESDPRLKVDRTVARTYLSNTKPLVLIDRFDIPVQSLITLPDYFPKGAVVVTTLDAIPTEAYESIGLAPLSRDDSIQLLSVKSGIDRNAGSTPIMDEICAILVDVPLAITILAKAIREKRTALPDVPNQLKRLQSSSPDKTQAAIERGYALVYSLLNREERDALLAAAVSSGISIDREMLESIVGKEAINSLEALEILKANSPRLQLPDGLREIILTSSKNTSLFREKFLDRITKQLTSRSLDFDFISDELGNLLGLLQWAENEKRWSDVITLGKAIDPYLMLHGLWDAWQTVLQQILSAADQLSDTATRAWALHQLGTRAAGFGNLSQAKDLLEQALETRKSIGDKIGAAYTQHNLWVLFPPLPFWKDPSRWIIPGLIAVAAIIAGLILGNILWATYRNDEYNFEFRYPNKGVLSLETTEPVVATIFLPSYPNAFYDTRLDVIANQGKYEYPCQVPINPENWVVERITLNDVQFIKATQKIILDREANYEVFATKEGANTWVCLVFSYLPRELAAEQPEDRSSGSGRTVDTRNFLEIVETFRWSNGGPIPVSTTITFTSTASYTPTQTSTSTGTPTPTFTSTPTNTHTASPTSTPTPCISPAGWSIYIVQFGDTLSDISLWYSDLGTTVAGLQKANCKSTPDIRSGESLYVPRTPPPARITGYVFADPNRNFVQDDGEQRLSKVTVTLTDTNGTVVATTVTNSDGTYSFSNLNYGLYEVFQYQIFVRPNQVVQRNFGVVPVP